MLLKCSILAVKYNTKRALCLLSLKLQKDKARAPSTPLIFLDKGKIGDKIYLYLKSLNGFRY